MPVFAVTSLVARVRAQGVAINVESKDKLRNLG